MIGLINFEIGWFLSQEERVSKKRGSFFPTLFLLCSCKSHNDMMLYALLCPWDIHDYDLASKRIIFWGATLGKNRGWGCHLQFRPWLDEEGRVAGNSHVLKLFRYSSRQVGVEDGSTIGFHDSIFLTSCLIQLSPNFECIYLVLLVNRTLHCPVPFLPELVLFLKVPSPKWSNSSRKAPCVWQFCHSWLMSEMRWSPWQFLLSILCHT